ncbi:TetR/AcrR family transcriptional regulator [Chenggangzhangella methanolivorans]|uniref:TetR/AcrR family transcriptional regulator n=1 Tax=Chenggangzhangella methanolivorans TaxID=1437009 RepID=A0A9E6UNN0_9HYPH|nr:TetR/AcrR family transcriptional regulator [Chenggangzhangella methanolivorans]QZN98729.1 TetR/AcrR family transcriptional regulator [Chenggangzhangella methanolivorans]
MPLSKEHKAQTRERILKEAGALFRRDGVEAVSVPALMKQAGLTHGGFYAHFASKDALVAEALAEAQERSSEFLQGVARHAKDPVAAVVDTYVSAVHRDRPEGGCAVATLGSEAARGETETKRSMGREVRRTVERLAETLKLPESRHDDAIALFAGMVGALVLARASAGDAAFSDHVLEVCRDRMKSLAR